MKVDDERAIEWQCDVVKWPKTSASRMIEDLLSDRAEALATIAERAKRIAELEKKLLDACALPKITQPMREMWGGPVLLMDVEGWTQDAVDFASALKGGFDV